MTENYKRVYYKMSYYPPYKSSSSNDKVELDLTNYGTKTDLKNITHVDVSSSASKTNLASLKTEVDKIDVNKLKTAPVDLGKLTNAIENYLVKKSVYNTKVTSIETQIAGLTKNTVDNSADITKLKAIGTNSFVLKTKLASDVTTLENKIDIVDKNKINDTVPHTYNIKDLNDEEIIGSFYDRELQQNNVLTSSNDHVINDNVVNIYIVYKLDPITLRDTTFTIQNASFGAMQITKNSDTSKYNYKDMVYVLMKLKKLLTYEKETILVILQWLET